MFACILVRIFQRKSEEQMEKNDSQLFSKAFRLKKNLKFSWNKVRSHAENIMECRSTSNPLVQDVWNFADVLWGCNNMNQRGELHPEQRIKSLKPFNLRRAWKSFFRGHSVSLNYCLRNGKNSPFSFLYFIKRLFLLFSYST